VGVVAEKNNHVKKMHFLHGFPGLFPNCPQFARKRRVRNFLLNNAQYTHSEKTYLFIYLSAFTFFYSTLHNKYWEKEGKNLQTIIDTYNHALRGILTGNVLYLFKCSLQTDEFSLMCTV